MVSWSFDWLRGSGRWGWIVPGGLWEIAKRLLPPTRVRPQAGGVANIDDEAVFAAIIYVLVGGCAWRALPPCFGASKSTVHRRFLIWSRAGVWGRLHQKMLELLDGQNLVDLSRAVLDSAHVRAEKKGGELAGPPRGPGQARFQHARRRHRGDRRLSGPRAGHWPSRGSEGRHLCSRSRTAEVPDGSNRQTTEATITPKRIRQRPTRLDSHGRDRRATRTTAIPRRRRRTGPRIPNPAGNTRPGAGQRQGRTRRTRAEAEESHTGSDRREARCLRPPLCAAARDPGGHCCRWSGRGSVSFRWSLTRTL